MLVLNLADSLVESPLDENEFLLDRFAALLAGLSRSENDDDEIDDIDGPTLDVITANVQDAWATLGADTKLIDTTLSIKRLNNLMNEGPKLKFDQTEVNWIGNTSALLHSTPNFITLNADGSTIEGDIQPGKAAKFIPSSDARRVKNMSTMLVTKGTFMRAMSPNIGAGDFIEINQRKYFILTAAHRFDTVALGGSTVSASKFWFAEVQSP